MAITAVPVSVRGVALSSCTPLLRTTRITLNWSPTFDLSLPIISMTQHHVALAGCHYVYRRQATCLRLNRRSGRVFLTRRFALLLPVAVGDL